MTKLEENLNKATNLLLSIGSICLITSVSALLIMSNLGALQFETAPVAVAMIAVFGLALVVASSFLWRKLPENRPASCFWPVGPRFSDYPRKNRAE